MAYAPSATDEDLDDVFVALLGTDDAKGLFYMLGDHSDDLEIMKIRVFLLNSPNPGMETYDSFPADVVGVGPQYLANAQTVTLFHITGMLAAWFCEASPTKQRSRPVMLYQHGLWNEIRVASFRDSSGEVKERQSKSFIDQGGI